MNRLYYGDNLDVLRDHIASDSIDLVYLDPPFNSNANYNILFKSPTGKAADSQIEAFEDSWHWNDKAEAAFHDVMTSGNTDVAELLRAMRGFLKENDMMAYLAMMAVRLIELHRVLKPTGSLYLHCDPTASHYLKLLLDGVFGAVNYGNEIIWQRQNAKGNASTRFARNHDVILRYTKADSWTWNAQYTAHNETYVDGFYRFNEEGTERRYRLADLTNPNKNRPNLTYEFLGITRVWRWTRERMQAAYDAGLVIQTNPGTVPQLKRYLDEQEGNPVSDIWADIRPVQSQSKEDKHLGYPTQKPLALLERIIAASSNPGDVVLDPFCGCGTAVDAAQKLGRQWIGIDVTTLSTELIEKRMKDRYGLINVRELPLKGRHAELVSASTPQSAKPSQVEGWTPDQVRGDGAGVDASLVYEVVGTPNDIASAEKLAAEQPYQFQYWIVGKIDGQPYQGGRKGADRGIDGYVYFTGHDRKTEAAIISVKAGRNVGVAMVRDLKGVVEREKAPIGIFVCVINPTREMEREAASMGVYEGADGRTYPRLQIYTVAEYFAGLRPKVPLLDRQAAYRKAARAETGKGNLAFDL